MSAIKNPTASNEDVIDAAEDVLDTSADAMQNAVEAVQDDVAEPVADKIEEQTKTTIDNIAE